MDSEKRKRSALVATVARMNIVLGLCLQYITYLSPYQSIFVEHLTDPAAVMAAAQTDAVSMASFPADPQIIEALVEEFADRSPLVRA